MQLHGSGALVPAPDLQELTSYGSLHIAMIEWLHHWINEILQVQPYFTLRAGYYTSTSLISVYISKFASLISILQLVHYEVENFSATALWIKYQNNIENNFKSWY
jgi:hypothetical protein